MKEEKNKEIKEKTICYYCGKEISTDEETYETNDVTCCDNCYHERFITCDSCGDEICVEDSVYIEETGENLCGECADRYYCQECGEYHESVETYSTIHGERQLCNECFSDYYVCGNCRELVPADETCYLERQDEYLCPSCLEEIENSNDGLIQDYRYKPTPIFYATKNENIDTSLFFGIELELEDINDTFCKDLLNIINNTKLNDILYFKSDSSLCDNSVEIVSHPFTYNFLIENINTFVRIFDYIDSNSTTSSRTGLHIHTNRNYFKNEDAIDKYILFFEYYMEEIKYISMRHNYSYCSFLQDMTYLNTDLKRKAFITKENIKDKKNRVGRYVCINVENRNTIECRIFEATTDLNTFIAYIELLQAIINLCNSKKETEFGFETILKQNNTTYLNNFIDSINMEIPKGKIKNNRALVIRETNKNKRIVIDIKRDLIDFINENLGYISKNQKEAMRDYYINFCLSRLNRRIKKSFTNNIISNDTLDILCDYLNSLICNIRNELNVYEFSKRQAKILEKLSGYYLELNKMKGEILQCA